MAVTAFQNLHSNPWECQTCAMLVSFPPPLPHLPTRRIGPPPLARLAMSCPACSWTTRPTHVPGRLGSMSPYRYTCCCTGSYAAWPWKEPLIDWRTHTINKNTSCMPLQGTTKPSPFDWLAIMSKNHVICTKQLLRRVNIMSKQKTSSVIMSVLWVGRVKTVDAFSMRRLDWIFFILWVMR